MSVYWKLTNRMEQTARITMDCYLKHGENREIAEDDFHASTSKFNLEPEAEWKFEFYPHASKAYYKLTLQTGEFKPETALRRQSVLLVEFYSNDIGDFDILEPQ